MAKKGSFMNKARREILSAAKLAANVAASAAAESVMKIIMTTFERSNRAPKRKKGKPTRKAAPGKPAARKKRN